MIEQLHNNFFKGIFLILLSCATYSMQAQNEPLYIDAMMTVSSGSNLQAYSYVELGPNAKIYLQDGENAYFYGIKFKADKGARIYGVPAGSNIDWVSENKHGEGTGVFYFKQTNPMDNSQNRQSIDGGNSGYPAESTENTFTTIEIDNPNGVELTDNYLRVGTAIYFTNGNLYLNDFDAILTEQATLNNYTNHKFVVTNFPKGGHLVKENYKDAFTFPVGIAADDYTPVTLTSTAQKNTLHVNVREDDINDPTDVTTPGIQRIWNIYGENNSEAIVSLQHNTQTNLSHFSPIENYVTQYGNAPNASGDFYSDIAWQYNTPRQSTTGSYYGSEVVSRTYVTMPTTPNEKEADFSKSSYQIDFPVQLEEFRGHTINCKNAYITWKTTTEPDDAVFYLDKFDGDTGQWVEIYTTNSFGIDTTYFTLATFNPGENVYRLRVQLSNGYTTVYDNIVINNECNTEKDNNIVIFPVPAKDYLTISSDKPLYSITCFDELGRILFIKEGNSSYNQTIDVRKLESHVYYILIVYNGGRQTLDFIKL